MQADILDGGPDNRQATGFRREHVNLIGALAHIAEQAFNGIRGLNVAVQTLRKGIKRQEVLFVLRQASQRFRIALRVLGFEGSQLDQCLLFCRLLPDTYQFGLDISPFSSGDGSEDIALLMHETALTRGRRKPVRDRSQQSIMSIRHDEINLGGSPAAHILQKTVPSIFAFLCTDAESQNLFVPCQVHP